MGGSNRTAAGLAAAAAAIGGAIGAARWMTKESPPSGGDGWVGVTVLRTPEEFAPGGELPEPLRRLGAAIEVRTEPAPGGRGTEVYARLTGEVPDAGRLTGQDALAPVRTALREAKALAETGEVVRSDERRTPHPGPAGRLLQAVDRRAQGAGRL